MARAVTSVALDRESLTIIEQAEQILKKEGKKFNLSKYLQDLVKTELINLVKGHGDGNPSSSIDQYFEEGFMVTPALARAISPEYIDEFLRKISTTKQFEEIGGFLTVWSDKYNAIVDELKAGQQTL